MKKLLIAVFVIFIAATAHAQPGLNYKVVKAYGDGPAAAGPLPATPAASYDAGEYYVVGGKRVGLLRSLEEVAVVYEKGAQEPSPAGTDRFIAGKRFVKSQKLDGAKPVDTFVMDEAASPREMEYVVAGFGGEPGVKFAHEVFINAESGLRQILTDEVALKVVAGTTEGQLIALVEPMGAVVSVTKPVAEDEYLVEVVDPMQNDALNLANELTESPLVIWAEPNFKNELRRSYIPDDPLFGDQWHLDNTGQGGGTPDADVDAPEAWDMGTGGTGMTIAIVDDGVETTHEDLSPNIWVNPGEIPGNGIDDDGNGRIDDVNGYDFINHDNNPNPTNSIDNHGTAVAGVAAARGDNSKGVSGVAPFSKILPVKLIEGLNNVSSTDISDAIHYAADNADVINCSWGISSNNAIDSALAYAVTSGRGGKGTPVFFATGNEGFDWIQFTLTGIPAGTYTFRWEYKKNASINHNYDTVWLDDVTFPGGATETFEGGPSLPAGWTTGGNRDWSVPSDGHSHGGSRSAKAGAISGNGSTWIQVTRTLASPGNLVFWAFVSSEDGMDEMNFYVDDFTEGAEYFSFSGPPPVGYPASNPDTIAVGASTNTDTRAYYSQYGPGLDFLAPSGGGTLSITTTDRTGAAGYGSSSYMNSFAGTSASCPLAAGTAALLLSEAPGLTALEVRQMMQNSCDKVGPIPYDAGGYNIEFGYGRVNAASLLAELNPVSAITAPANGINIEGTNYTITGTAQDMSGSGLAYVEVSTDGGSTWELASDTSGNGSWTAWNYDWTLPSPGTYTVKSRARDNAGGVETPGAGATVTVGMQVNYDLTVDINPPGSGTVDVTPTGPYAPGLTAYLTAAPEPGYFFSGWSGPVADPASASTSVTMDSDKTVTANFVLVELFLSHSQNDKVVTMDAELNRGGASVAEEILKFYYSMDGGLTWRSRGKAVTGLTGVGTKIKKFREGTYLIKAQYAPRGFEPVESNVVDLSVASVVALSPEHKAITSDPTPTVTWEPLPDATGYLLQTSSRRSFRIDVTEIPVGLATSADLPAMLPDQKLFWRVVATIPTGRSVGSRGRLITYMLP